MLHFFAGAQAVQKALERECSKCGLKQRVSPDQLKETVPCRKCGTLLAPKGSQ